MRYWLVALCVLTVAGCAHREPVREVEYRDRIKVVREPYPVACPTDEQLVAAIILASRETYFRKERENKCPCEDDVDVLGIRCGKRSADKQERGDKPFCRPEQVTPDVLAKARAALPNNAACVRLGSGS